MTVALASQLPRGALVVWHWGRTRRSGIVRRVHDHRVVYVRFRGLNTVALDVNDCRQLGLAPQAKRKKTKL
jgi:hypothetical protein